MNFVKVTRMEVKFVIFLMARWWSILSVSKAFLRFSTGVTVLPAGIFLLKLVFSILFMMGDERAVG